MDADGKNLHMITGRTADRPRFIDWAAGRKGTRHELRAPAFLAALTAGPRPQPGPREAPQPRVDAVIDGVPSVYDGAFAFISLNQFIAVKVRPQAWA